MRLRCRPSWAIVGFGLVFAACGADAEPDRLTLRTPGAETGRPLAPTPVPTATPKATASPKPKPEPTPKPVTSTEKRVIRGWSDELRHGRVEAAARYFSVPSRASNVVPGWQYLETQADVEKFNADLPCGAKLLTTRRSAEPTFVVGVFRLTERPGRGKCGTGTGGKVAVAFRIYRDHITSWVRADSEIDEPTPTPTASPKSTPSPEASDSA